MPGMPPVEVRWVILEDRSERQSLDRWCASVGPVMVITTADPVPAQVDALAILSWNVHVGGGYRDPAYRTMASAFGATPEHDRRPTFAGLLRLDHAFFRLPAHWQATLARLNDRFGSDHHPLLGWVAFHRASG